MSREQRGPRVFVSGLEEHLSRAPGAALLLPFESSHHIKDVLRLREADLIELACPSTGTVYRGEIESLVGGVHVRIIDSLAPSISKSPPVTLLCALCKGQKNDLVCDWATELGSARIVFWQASRSIVRLGDAKDIRSKEARLSKIALAAAQQSRQARPPTVLLTSTLSDALSVVEEASDTNPLKVVCSLSNGTAPIREALSTSNAHSSIHIAIGPEGDMTAEEETLLSERGFIRVSLGGSILRSELAVVAALVVAKEISA